ncbi:MAG: MarR family winged helix-turn-helix transcriptional regulator [Campylobacteraceae bacterium]|nr:MarR family winged helix-turn-helix transcriptional regulator [Campylobacteraceae bacterium]
MDRTKVVEAFEKTHNIMHKLAGKLTLECYKKYSPHQMMAILWLDKNGKNRLKDIADQTKMSTSSLCVMFNTLDKNALIIREIDKNDRRNTYYSLSDEGKATAAQIMEQIREAMLKIFKPLDDNELEKIADSFGVINEILKKCL